MAVLGLARFGDIHLGHDLEAGDDRGLDRLGAAHHLVQDAVDAEPNTQVVLLRLDVDVGGAVGDGLLDDVVDELDRRRFDVDVGELVEFLVGTAPRADEHVLSSVLGDLVVLLDGREDVVLRRDRRLDLAAGDDPEVVEREDVLRVGHRDHEHVVAQLDRHESVARREFLGHDDNGGRLGLALGEIDVLDADLLRHDRQDRALSGVAEIDQNATERAARGTVHLESVVELFLGDDARSHQKLAEPCPASATCDLFYDCGCTDQGTLSSRGSGT